MNKTMMLDEGLNILEEGIVKSRKILLGFPIKTVFNAEDYMKFYNCVYCMCTQKYPHDYGKQLYERFESIWKESITSVVLPLLEHKHDASLLIELVQIWEKYNVMAELMCGLFRSLENRILRRSGSISLSEITIQCFRDQVCHNSFDRFRGATVSLINQERIGKQVDPLLLKSVLHFFVVVGDTRTKYYENFENAMLADAACYYAQLASELLSCNSCADYIQKAESSLTLERERASQYLPQGTLEKLVQVMMWQLLGQTANVLTEKQKAESHGVPAYEDLLSKYANMKIEEGSSVALSQQGSIL